MSFNCLLSDTYMEDEPTPTSMSDVVVRTPANDAATPGWPQKSPEQLEKSPEESAWTPSYSAATADHYVTDGSRANWKEASVGELHQLKLEAVRSDGEGSLFEAEHKFQDVLCGFRHHLGATNRHTVKSAYQLASFFANHSRMGEAHKVLQWVLDKHIEKWTLEHSKTIKYFMHVIELHHVWTRDDDAVTLLRRILPLLQNISDENSSEEALANWDKESGLESRDGDDSDDESLVELQVDTHLRIVHAWLDFGTSSFNRLLSRFIAHCKRYPESLSLQMFQARLMLVKDFATRGQVNEGMTELKLARRSMVELFSDADESPPCNLLSASRGLAFLHLMFDDVEEDCERILSWVADRLESRLPFAARGSVDKAREAVDYLVQTYLAYQSLEGYGWEDTAHWLERAYGLAVRVGGPSSRLAISLEESLKNQALKLDDEEPTPEISLRSKKFFLSLATGT